MGKAATFTRAANGAKMVGAQVLRRARNIKKAKLAIPVAKSVVNGPTKAHSVSALKTTRKSVSNRSVMASSCSVVKTMLHVFSTMFTNWRRREETLKFSMIGKISSKRKSKLIFTVKNSFVSSVRLRRLIAAGYTVYDN